MPPIDALNPSESNRPESAISNRPLIQAAFGDADMETVKRVWAMSNYGKARDPAGWPSPAGDLATAKDTGPDFKPAEPSDRLIVAITDASDSGRFNYELRSAIADWARMPGDESQALGRQNALNHALSGTGLQSRFVLSTYRDYLGRWVPITTVTLNKGRRHLESFSYTDKYYSSESQLEGQSTKAGLSILDDYDPDRTVSPAMAKHLEEVRDLEIIMQSAARRRSDGRISPEELNDENQSSLPNRHAQEYLRSHFSELAGRKGPDCRQVISKDDLKDALIRALTVLMQDSVRHNRAEIANTVAALLKTAIDENLVGSEPLSRALNSALNPLGYGVAAAARAASGQGETLYLFEINPAPN